MGKRNVEVGFYSLDKQHLQARDEVLKRFKTQMKMVREDISEKYQMELEKVSVSVSIKPLRNKDL